jgi:hypothetical protein
LAIHGDLQMATIQNLQPDLIIPFGPNCRNTFNVRQYFGITKAYPFDWWIVPIASAFYMLDPEFRFSVSLTDLIVIETGGKEDSVYNRKLHILHHHDFPRDNFKVVPITEELLKDLNDKYQYLFRRMQDEVSAASQILFISHGLRYGMREIDYSACLTPRVQVQISLSEASLRMRSLFGDRASMLVIDDGEAAFSTEGCATWIKRPDNGVRRYPVGHQNSYAEPLNTYQSIFIELGLSSASRSD